MDTENLSDQIVDAIVAFLTTKLADNKRRAITRPEVYDHLVSQIDTDKMTFLLQLSKAVKEQRLPGFEMKIGKNGGIGFADRKRNAIPPPAMFKRDKPVSDTTPPSTDIDPIIPDLIESSKVQPTISPKDLPTEAPPAAEEPESKTIPSGRYLPLQTLPAEALRPSAVPHCVVTIGERSYEVPVTASKMISILTQVFNAKEDEAGSISVGENNYSCEDDRVIQYVDNIIFFIFGGKYSIQEDQLKSA